MTTNLHRAGSTDTKIGELLSAQILPEARRSLLRSAIGKRAEAAVACLRVDANITEIFVLLSEAQHDDWAAACLLQWLDHPELIDAWAAFAKLDPTVEIHKRGGEICALHAERGVPHDRIPLVQTAIAALRALGLTVHEKWSKS